MANQKRRVTGRVVGTADDEQDIAVDSSGVVQVSPAAAATPTTVETKAYTAPASGELAGSTSAAQLPNVPCKLVRFRALSANAGKVYIGVAGVTLPNGTTDTTTGLQLAAGDDTGWIPVDNLNRFYRICDNAGDGLTYLAMN